MSESNSNSNSNLKSSSKKPGGGGNGGGGGGRRGRGGGRGRGGRNNGRGRGGGRGRGRGRGRGNNDNNNNNNNNNNRGGAATGDGYREGDTCKLAYETSGEEKLELQQQFDDNSSVDDDNSTTSMDHHHCLVCYSPTLHTSRGITPCNHDTICASCHLRLRSLLGDTRCPICKATNDTVIIDADPDSSIDEHKSYDQYERWGDDLGPNYIYHDDVQMFFPVAYYHRKVVPLFSLRCYVRGCNYGNTDSGNNSNNNNVTLKGLNHHLAAAHSLSLCQLCVENKRDFISRLPRYTPNQLKEHNKYGDIITSSKRGRIKNEANNTKGHPLCQFCAPKRFYDLTALHEHLNKEHYKCHICEKLGLHNQFFRDYHKLSMHFEKEHYLCPHPDCLAARFIVFANEIDLIAHERDVHNIVSRNGGGRTINIEFNYRPSGRGGDYIIDENQTVPDLEDDFNYGLNGEVFVPEALEDGEGQQEQQQQVNEPEITHGPHAERTAFLREQARRRREELGLGNEQKDGDETEAFPALGSSGGVNNLRWSTAATTANGGTSMVTSLRGRNSTALTTENFPSLGGGQAKKKSAISSKLRVTRGNVGGGVNAPSLVAVARSVAPSYTSSRAATATTPAYYSSNIASSMNSAANLTSNNFPSLGGGSSLGSGNSSTSTANKYAQAQAFAKKASLSSDNFPSLSNNNSSSTTAQVFAKKKKNSVFDPPKKTPALDNVLDFPAPLMSSSATSNGVVQIEKMKKTMGQAKYKQLKKLTKQFATNELDPESYVSSAVHLFDKGIEDEHFWEFVPSLISSCPNESSSKRAKRYLDSMRYPILQAQQTGASASNNASMNRSGSGKSYVASNAGWSDHVSSIQNSFQRAQPKKKSAWAASQSKKLSHSASSKINSSIAEGALEGPRKGTATKYMAKERAEEKKMKQIELEAQKGGTGKKKKATAKKNELRDLAFGKN